MLSTKFALRGWFAYFPESLHPIYVIYSGGFPAGFHILMRSIVPLMLSTKMAYWFPYFRETNRLINVAYSGGSPAGFHVLMRFIVPLMLSTRMASRLVSLFSLELTSPIIANGKKRVILCNNFTGRISVTLLCGICDVSYPTKQR